MPTIKPPLDPVAAAAADAAVAPDTGGRRLTMGRKDLTHRKKWMKAYRDALNKKKTPRAAKPPASPKQTCLPSTLKVIVSEKHSGETIEGVKVKISGPESHNAVTSGAGSAMFPSIAPGTYKIQVEQDEFILNPDSASVSLKEGATEQLKLRVTRQMQTVKIKRNNIHLTGDDKYGHWWTEIDSDNDGNFDESYGWWPAEPLGLWETMTGVKGDLNGQTLFGGTTMLDPHHGDPPEEEFNPYVRSGKTASSIKKSIKNFANSYSGEWRWTFEYGQNCHTFQEGLMEKAKMTEKP